MLTERKVELGTMEKIIAFVNAKENKSSYQHALAALAVLLNVRSLTHSHTLSLSLPLSGSLAVMFTFIIAHSHMLFD
jgi:hypothetical protein